MDSTSARPTGRCLTANRIVLRGEIQDLGLLTRAQARSRRAWVLLSCFYLCKLRNESERVANLGGRPIIWRPWITPAAIGSIARKTRPGRFSSCASSSHAMTDRCTWSLWTYRAIRLSLTATSSSVTRARRSCKDSSSSRTADSPIGLLAEKADTFRALGSLQKNPKRSAEQPFTRSKAFDIVVHSFLLVRKPS